MRPGVPDSTQIRFTLKIQPETSLPVASGAPETGNEVDKNRTSAGENRKLKGPLTRYTVEFGVPARDLILDAASDGARQGGIESMLVVYDQDGKPQNWTLRHFDLHWDAARYELVQVHGIHLRLEIDVPKSGVYLQCGIYDQLSNQAGTLEVPLSSVVTGQAAASKSFAEAPSPSSVGPENNPATSPSETPSFPAGAASGKSPATDSATIAEVPSISPRTPQDDQAMLSSGKDVSKPQAKTATYVDYPSRTLKTAVPTLNGLKYDANQDQLSSILTRLAKTIDDALVRLPNLVSHEEVYRGKQGPDAPDKRRH
jgi:hypothetical protein